MTREVLRVNEAHQRLRAEVSGARVSASRLTANQFRYINILIAYLDGESEASAGRAFDISQARARQLIYRAVAVLTEAVP